MFVNKITIGPWLSYRSKYAFLGMYFIILYNIVMYYDFPAPFPLNSSLVDKNVVRQTVNIKTGAIDDSVLFNMLSS